MAADTEPTPPTNGNGNRSVSNWELKLLSQDIAHKLEILTTKLDASTVLVAAQGVQVETNRVEIEKLREHHHDMANVVQRHEALAVVLPVERARELAQVYPAVRGALDMMERRRLVDVMTPRQLELVQALDREFDTKKVKVLADMVTRRTERTVIWRGSTRDALFAIGAIVGLIIANIIVAYVVATWHP